MKMFFPHFIAKSIGPVVVPLPGADAGVQDGDELYSFLLDLVDVFGEASKPVHGSA